MYNGKIRVLMIKPMERPKVCYVEPTIKTFRRVINARDIQAKRLEIGVYVIFNKGSFLSDNTPNRYIGDSIIKGTMIVVATDEKRVPISLTDDKVSKYNLRFGNVETFDEI